MDIPTMRLETMELSHIENMWGPSGEKYAIFGWIVGSLKTIIMLDIIVLISDDSFMFVRPNLIPVIQIQLL